MNTILKYYNFSNGEYTEDANGYLAGLEVLDANQNIVRKIIISIDANMLRNQRINYTYVTQVKPNGFTEWLSKDQVSIQITNTNFLDEVTGEQVSRDIALSSEGALNPGFVPQFSAFIEMIGKNSNAPVSLYALMVKEIARQNGYIVV